MVNFLYNFFQFLKNIRSSENLSKLYYYRRATRRPPYHTAVAVAALESGRPAGRRVQPPCGTTVADCHTAAGSQPYKAQNLPENVIKIQKKEREGGEGKEGSEVEVVEEAAKLCRISQFEVLCGFQLSL